MEEGMEGSVPADGEGQIQWLPKVFMGKNIFGENILPREGEMSDAIPLAVDGEDVKGSVRSSNGALSASGKIVKNPEGPVFSRKGR